MRRARFGQLSIFVGNAGIYDQRTSITDIPFDKLDFGIQ